MMYLDWLKSQVEYFDGPKHNCLLDNLYEFAYVPTIDRDRNRYYDGIELRDEYFKEFTDDPMIIDAQCSFLEFLIALARRMNYIYARIDEDRTADCFWMLVNNLRINFDDESDYFIGDISAAVDAVNTRSYQQDGTGGLFPLKHPRENQRNVEVWYQMNQYLNELMVEEGRL